MSAASYEALEVTKTTVVALPPYRAEVVTRFQRARTRERVNQPSALTGTVVYLTSFAALSQPIPITPVTQPLVQTEGTPVSSISPLPTQTTQPTPTQLTPLVIQTYKLTVGTSSTQLSTTITQARRVTILADSNNVGVIWISTSYNSPAGVGFPLVAGAAKDFGSPSMNDKFVNLTSLYVIGTASGDTVEVAVEI